MVSEPDLAELLDVRTVSISWVGDEAEPTVSFEGCSHFEALGMTLCAADYLRDMGAIGRDDDEADDDE